jgi:hypothetical protein
MPKSAVGKKATVRTLDAIALKEVLWDTLSKIRRGKITAGGGDAIAAQAREILRTAKVQLAILGQAGKAVTTELVRFADPE